VGRSPPRRAARGEEAAGEGTEDEVTHELFNRICDTITIVAMLVAFGSLVGITAGIPYPQRGWYAEFRRRRGK
jgi:hypothetical protein